MRSLPNLAVSAIAAIGTVAVAIAPLPVLAQTRTAPSVADPRPVTRVLAVGRLTSKATPTDLPPVLVREVPATLQLYLAGKIADWYAKPDQSGVVFILNVTSIEEARAILAPLPLGQAGMMTFDLTPLGPLQPLGLLLR